MLKPEMPGDRRDYLRLDFRQPLRFRLVPSPDKALHEVSGKNISVSGLLFKSRVAPPLSSVLWMDVDTRTLRICREIDERVLVQDGGLIGRVVRVEENPGEAGTFSIGVCFLRKSGTGRTAG